MCPIPYFQRSHGHINIEWSWNRERFRLKHPIEKVLIESRRASTLYLAAAFPSVIWAGTHFSLQVAGLAVRSCSVTLTLEALLETNANIPCFGSQWSQGLIHKTSGQILMKLPESYFVMCIYNWLSFSVYSIHYGHHQIQKG